MAQRLWALYAAAALGLCMAQVAPGQLITDAVWRNSTNTDTPQIVPQGLQVGAPVFVDRINVNNRTTRFAAIPESLLGLDYVMLANNDRSTPNFGLDVTLSRAGAMYLFIDNRVGDNVAANGAITRGIVWQFQVEPQGCAIDGTQIKATAFSSSGTYGPDKTIDGSGLDGQDGHSTSAKDMWQSAPGATGPAWIQYEFDRVYKLHEMQAWNYNSDLEFMVNLGLKSAI